jgi:hypothetical protein
MVPQNMPTYAHAEVTTLIIPVFAWPFIVAFWIFTLWMLWIVAKSLKGTDQSLKEIARKLQPKN